MPKNSNIFYPDDKLEIIRNLISAGINVRQTYLGDYINDAQAFVIENNIMPGSPSANNVSSVVSSNNNYKRVYFDGGDEPISEDQYIYEVIYNYLPGRFKMMTSEGAKKQ